MSQIKIELIIDKEPLTEDQKNVVLAAIGAEPGILATNSKGAVKTTEKKAPAKDKAPSKKAAESKDDTTGGEDDSNAKASTITKTDIMAKARKTAKENDGDNRPKIKAKLKELGAANLASLEEDKYDEFNEWLDSL